MKKIQKLFKEFYDRTCGHVFWWLQHLESSKTFIFMTNHKYINILYYVMFLNSIGCLFFFKESNLILLFSFVYFLFSLYLLLYAFLDIPKNILSFISFIFNFVIGCLYLRALYFLLYKGFDIPIFVEDLTLFSQYRYLFMLILYISGLILFLISLKYNKLKNIFSTYNLSFFKKEFINVIQACPRFELFLNKICSYVLDSLIYSSYFRVVYFCLHFFVNYLYRIFILLFFINFCFFHGDLRYVLYFLPVSFFFWVYSFAAYYFSWFFDDNYSYLRDLFHVTLLNKKEYYSPDVNCVITDVSNLDFKLTSYAMEQNINEEHISSLKDGWLKLSKVQVAFDRYNHKTSFISSFIFGFYIICWLNICYTFVDLSVITFMTSNPFCGFFTIIRRGFHTTQPKCYPRKAYYVHENFMNALKEKTAGKYSPGHMVYGDTNASGSIELEGQLTSDKNNKVLDAKQISDTNLKGKNSPQKVVKFENPTSVPPSSVNVVPNSEAYFDRDSIKNSLDTLHSSKINDTKE